MTSKINMAHMEHLPAVAEADVAVLRDKEATYQGSWKAAGGRSAWFMFRRNMDRLLNMCAAKDFKVSQSDIKIPSGNLELGPDEVKRLNAALRAEDLFLLIEAAPGGEDGTVLACLRDLRRYALLVESEMVSRGVVRIEGGKPADPPSTLASSTSLATTLVSSGPPGTVYHPMVPPPETAVGTLADVDLARVEAALVGYSGLSHSDEQILEAITRILTSNSHHVCSLHVPIVRNHLNGGTDFYTALGRALSIPRSAVKERLFLTSYSGETLVEGPKAPSPRSPIQEIGDEIRQDLLTKDWERQAIEEVVRYAFNELGDGSRQELVEAALATRPGGGVYGRVAEAYKSNLGDMPADVVTDVALSRQYAPPGQEYDPRYDVALHSKIRAAVSHALNYHSIDAALGCADHILADLITPAIVNHLEHRTSGQLLAAGWGVGLDGVMIPPDKGIQASPFPLDKTAATLGASSPADTIPPGTPEDGGHHGNCGCAGESPDKPIVPRISSVAPSELFQAVVNQPRTLELSEIRAAVLISGEDDIVGHAIFGVCGPLKMPTFQIVVGGVARRVEMLSSYTLERAIKGWIKAERPGRNPSEIWI